MTNYLSVSSVTKYIKSKFERDPHLERVYLTGEVSNFRRRPSHQYFSLKDEKAVIQATIWARVFNSLGFELEEGMKINVVGRVQLYAPHGSYSIIIEKAEPDGIGVFAIRFEKLKQKLTEEGIFKPEYKKAVPKFPKVIGVITSSSGAVIRDIVTTVGRRFPGVTILLFPTKVQGEGAAQEIAINIVKANQRDDIDVLIVGRGGGSIEDLWCFNDEIVVRSIFESDIPVISSVGHETDITLSDFVADKRASTPTAAAELATPVTKFDLLSYLNLQENRVTHTIKNKFSYWRERVLKLKQSVIFRQPERLYDHYIKKMDYLNTNLKGEIKEIYGQAAQYYQLLNKGLLAVNPKAQVERYQELLRLKNCLLIRNISTLYNCKLTEFQNLNDTLLTLDTNRILSRGYAIVKKNGVAQTIQGIEQKDQLVLQMQDGEIDVEVKNVKRNWEI